MPCPAEQAVADPAAAAAQAPVTKENKSLGDLQAGVLHELCEDEASQERGKYDSPCSADEEHDAPASVSFCCPFCPPHTKSLAEPYVPGSPLLGNVFAKLALRANVQFLFTTPPTCC
jgi:hypothetical protein